MKKALHILLPLLLSAAAAAQNPETDIRENPSRAGANYHAYEFVQHPETPAPEGFKPFYISHYGRHGSRNLSHDAFKYPVGKLELMKKKGLLNERGKTFLKEVKKLYGMSEDNWGKLTPRGAEEHARIATEMMDRYPEVFDGSPRIRARSSYVDRCRKSMASFTAAMQAKNPRAVIDQDGGKQYRYYLNDIGKEVSAPSGKTVDSLKKAWFHPEVFLAPLVTDCEKAISLMSKPEKFESELMEVCLITQCMPTDIELYDYFPIEELFQFWRMKNVQLWLRHGKSVEYGAQRVPLARNLALDIVHKADSSITQKCFDADVRFGHDSALMPLMCFLGAKGFDQVLPWQECDIWHSYSEICMGSNLQLVFYRDPASRILVKAVYNGRETSFPALGPGPYYSWSQFRTYVLSL